MKFKSLNQMLGVDPSESEIPLRQEAIAPMIDEPRNTNDDYFNYLNELEGYNPSAYTDTEGVPTVGTGLNLNNETVKQALIANPNTDFDRILAGTDEISVGQNRQIFDTKINEINNLFNKKRLKDFPNYKEKANVDKALMSVSYQSPEIIGPKISKALNENDIPEVGKELLLNSNKSKTPGVQARRLKEVKSFMGDDGITDIFDNMSSEEQEQIRVLINQIENKFTREQLLDEFPFLKKQLNPSRFNKLREE